MTSEDAIRIRHMLDAATETLAFTKGRNRDNLDTVLEDLEPLYAELEKLLTP